MREGARVALRSAGEEDRAFLARVYASTREEELAPVPFSPQQRAAFLAHQFAAQSAHYAQHHPGGSFDVIEVAGIAAGRLIVDRREGETRIVDISLLPEFRAQGVASAILARLLSEADDRGVPVSIHVEHTNRARALYERLGFAPVADRGVYVLMERPPRGGGQANTAS